MHVGCKIQFSVRGRPQHFGIAILRGGRTTGSYHIQHRSYESLPEHAGVAVTFGQRRIMRVEQFVGHTSHGHPLPGIAEDFGGRQHKNVIVRIAGHRRRIRRLPRLAQVLTEVHTEISHVFQYDNPVTGGQFTDNRQFAVLQTNPRRIVRIGVNDSRDVALFQITLQLLPQRLSPIMVDVELFPLRPDDAQLGFLDGKSRIDKQNLVFSRHALCGNDERPERGSHRTGRRYASPWRDVYIDKSLHEARSLALQFGNPVGCGVLRPHSTV